MAELADAAADRLATASDSVQGSDPFPPGMGRAFWLGRAGETYQSALLLRESLCVSPALGQSYASMARLQCDLGEPVVGLQALPSLSHLPPHPRRRQHHPRRHLHNHF